MGLRAWLALVLFAWAAATYAPIVTHEFVSYDDPSYVTNNATVKAGLTWRGVAWAFTTGHASNWHPLTWLSHMADVELFGLWAGGHHLGNLLLHAVNTVLVFLAFDRLVRVGWTRLGATDDERRRLAWQAATVAALFATHPLHVESVAWVAERKDTLSTLFWLLAMIAYAGYAARPGIVRYLAVAACLALGLLAKPMLVTLPCVLLLLDYWPLGRWQPPDWLAPRPAGASAGVPLWKLVVEKLPLVAIVVASALETMLVQRLGGALKSEAAYPWNVRIWNALFSYARYLLKTVFPENLSFFYPYPRKLLDRGFSEPRLLAALALLIVATEIGRAHV